MKTVIAEKPSVAREIARLLGATQKKDGYLEGSGYYVTWAMGHLVGLGMPEDYGITGSDRETLPILPKPFLLVPRTNKGEQRSYSDSSSNQLQTIATLFEHSNSIIVATDAGREGELIFRYLYAFLNCTKPFERLWISSLTEKAIRTGFQNLRQGKEFEGLFHAAQARSRADWLVGINATRALGIAAGSGNHSLGRVQTPTLAVVCKRFLEHSDFKPEQYWQLQLQHRKDFTDFISLGKERWENKKLVDIALRSIQRSGTATVTATATKSVTEQPPLLFDLTGLQKEANQRLGLTAEETLKIAQGLYEKKFITYPRTGSRHITEDLWAEIPDLVRALQDRENCKSALSHIRWGRFNKRIVDDLRVTDHHGLLPTGRIPSAVSIKENAVYDMIVFRLLEAISPACMKQVTDISLQVLHHDFTIKGVTITDTGWRSIRGTLYEEGDPVQELPLLQEGDEIKIKEACILEKKTRPAALYTEAGLLSAMENAGSQIQDAQERKALLGIGIGTPATRASIIETLLSRSYIKRMGRALIPTEKGLRVYAMVRGKKIADVLMTAQWEVVLHQIQEGKANAEDFQRDIENYATDIASEMLESYNGREKLPKLLCPKCQSNELTIAEKFAKCPDTKCSWIQFRVICGVTLSIADLEALINHRKTTLITGMQSRTGKKFEAYIVLDQNGASSFEFTKSKAKGT